MSDLARQVVVACKDRESCLARQVVVTGEDRVLLWNGVPVYFKSMK